MVKATKNVFVTFGAGRTGWIGAAKRITKEAERSNLFDFSFNLNEEWLKSWDAEIYRIGLRLRKTQQPRGFGYWTWKPSVLLWAHLNFPNHQIVYVDAGSEFIPIKDKLDFLSHHLKQSFNTGGLVWQLPNHFETCWTKKELLVEFSPSKSSLYSNQIQSGFIAIPPTHCRSSLVYEWRTWALKEDGFYFTDESHVNENAEFIEHRHDQSILSLIWKKYQLPCMLDLTNPSGPREIGLVASRNNSSLPSNANKFVRTLLKYSYLIFDKFLGKDDRRLRN